MGQPTKIGPNMSEEQLNIFRWSEKVRLLICMIGNELVYEDKKKIFVILRHRNFYIHEKTVDVIND